MPTVSICIPTYNGQQYLKQCIDSAVAQSYQDIEVLLIDDASTDNTWELIMSYCSSDKRIKAYRNEKNTGLVGNFNKCLQMAEGKWIKFLLQDDYLKENCIEIMMAGVSPEDKIAVCKRTFLLDDAMDENKKKYYEHGVATFERLGIVAKNAVFIKPKQVAAMAVNNICMNFIGEPTSVMLQRDVIKEIGYFNNDLAQICDLEYFLRIGSVYGIKYIPTELTYFRIHTQSATTLNLNAKLYVLTHIDPIITTHQLLFDKYYSPFRNHLSFIQKIKLKLYFLVHIHESYIAGQTDNAALLKFEAVSEKYPKIKQYKNGSIFIRILLVVIKAKRKVKN